MCRDLVSTLKLVPRRFFAFGDKKEEDLHSLSLSLLRFFVIINDCEESWKEQKNIRDAHPFQSNLWNSKFDFRFKSTYRIVLCFWFLLLASSFALLGSACFFDTRVVCDVIMLDKALWNDSSNRRILCNCSLFISYFVRAKQWVCRVCFFHSRLVFSARLLFGLYLELNGCVCILWTLGSPKTLITTWFWEHPLHRVSACFWLFVRL